MKHRIMITTLRKRDITEGLQYFCFSDGEKNMYCDALTSAEAGSKYILSRYKIDTIIAFGSDSSYDQGDDMRPIMLQEGNTFYAEDVEEMSSFSLYRYRLAEFLDEVDAEVMDVRELLDESQQEAAEEFIRDYFSDSVNTDGNRKFNRFFDRLICDDDLREDMEEQLRKSAFDIGADPDKYLRWVRNYIYQELRETSKMQLLDHNENVRIRFISSGDDEDNEKNFAALLINNLESISNISGYENDEAEIYLCIQNDNARDSFILTSLMETVRTMPYFHAHVAKVFLTDSPSGKMAENITDDTGKIEVNDLLSATKSFLRYGKTDLLLDLREASGIHNAQIERMLYAMRNIDTGISLCDITDIERGLSRLKELFSEGKLVTGDSFAEKFFNIIARGIREDYGPLLSGNDIDFIELVKWAYRKGFWQQTLTLIESRAPGEFADKGIYYYCGSEEDREGVVEKLGKIYFDLKPFEKYKLDDVDHYYLKFYSRWRSPRSKDSREYQLEYAKLRIEELDTDDPELIRACTLCPDRDALRELLFAYYYLGDVRNTTNHAIDEFSGFVSIMDDSDVSERMNLITQAVDYFLHCYEKVVRLISEADTEDAQIIRIETSELADYAKTLRRPPHDDQKKK